MANILLAEDDPSLRGFLAKALERAGHDVTACSDGETGLEALEDSDDGFDLLLTDIIMPGVDGIELARRAAEHHPDMKIMFITGFAAVAMTAAEETPEDAPVISKPFHLRKLVDEVNRLMAA